MTSCLLAQGERGSDIYGVKPKHHERNQALVHARTQAAMKQHAGDTNRLVLPGLIADRSKLIVEVDIELSAVQPDAPCEFLVVHESSDHTYETAFIAFAKPSDVNKALEFLGFRSGHSFEPTAFRFWPKGESFVLMVRGSGGEEKSIDGFLQDRRTGQSPPISRFLFTGSKWIDGKSGGTRVYASDMVQPKSIVSLFNTTYSVLEVPNRAPKDVVYQNTTLKREAKLDDDGLLTLVMRPYNSPGGKRVREIKIEGVTDEPLTGSVGSDSQLLESLRMNLRVGDQDVLTKSSIPGLLEKLAALDKINQDHYASIRFGSGLTLGHARAMASVLALVDSDRGIRIEPPDFGEIYYRSYLPDRELLDRKSRLHHPLELTLVREGDAIHGSLTVYDFVFKGDDSKGILESKEMRVADGSALAEAVKSLDRPELDATRKWGLRMLMVFAPSALSHEHLIRFIKPLLPQLTAIHIFVN